jgi:hypothetical protein
MTATSAPSDSRPGPFISYARKDQEFVHRLVGALVARGRDPWVDWELFPSTEWMPEIEAAMRAAIAILHT